MQGGRGLPRWSRLDSRRGLPQRRGDHPSRPRQPGEPAGRRAPNDNLEATHRSLFDGSLQGIQRTDKPAFGFQGHPEASPGPHDIAPVFDHFIELMAKV
ncbi:MAG: hypothetical protein JKY32_04410 [Rhizobiales bacterium]|nr:hypothetical protein [Hyphomicrobiales bacterium]